MKRPIYLDNHATTPVDPAVFEAMRPYFTEIFGNATSSQHEFGWAAKSGVEKAREQVANLIGAQPREIIFTSGATESIHLAVLGLLEKAAKPSHVITSQTEHKAVLEVCHKAETLGHEVTVLPVNRYGQVEVADVAAAIRPHTVLISLIYGNNEIGSLNPMAEIGQLAQEKNIFLHADAAQTVGKLPIDVNALGIDLLSISAHKLYGPKGVGALYVRQSGRRVRLSPFMVGGGQERGLRGGTLNVPGIAGLGAACEIAGRQMQEECDRLSRMRDACIETVFTALVDGVTLNGHPSDRLCNNISLSFEGVSADQLLLGLRHIAYSSGSACSSGEGEPSHVLKAIGHSDALARATVRFGLGRFTTDDELSEATQRLIETVRNARAFSKGYKPSSEATSQGYPNT